MTKDYPAAYFEDLADEIALEVEDFVDNIAPQVLDRPPFATNVPPEAQHQEWAAATNAMLAGDPTLLQQKFDLLTQLYGPEKGELLLRQWDARHAHMAAEGKY